MRTIQKNGEPPSLTAHRKTLHADYDNYSDKDALRQSLVEEQRGLCCYCQCRIHPDRAHMKIEHWQCRKNYPDRELEYSNLLGACLGHEGRPKREQHCDTHKHDEDLCFSPADRMRPIEQYLKFLGTGEIVSDNEEINTAINEVLNLNLGWLKESRKAVLSAFQERIGSGRLRVEHELRKWDGTQAGNLPQYAQVMVYWLEKRMKRDSK